MNPLLDSDHPVKLVKEYLATLPFHERVQVWKELKPVNWLGEILLLLVLFSIVIAAGWFFGPELLRLIKGLFH